LKILFKKLKVLKILMVLVTIPILFLFQNCADAGGGFDRQTSLDLPSTGEELTTEDDSEIEDVVNTITCPEGYVPVPLDENYVSKDFCVMKYEAKASTNLGIDEDGLEVDLIEASPISVPNNRPWRSITRTDARSACLSLGDGFDLISNAQWQTLARNSEQQPENWTGGFPGAGCLFQGNNGGAGCGYDGEDPENSSVNVRGILRLSNGEQVHDFAGNLTEWVADDNITNYGPNASFQNVSNLTHPNEGVLADGALRNAKAQFGPAIQYPGDSESLGLGFGLLNSSAGAMVRGGAWNAGAGSGVFLVNLSLTPGFSNTDIGFRCTFTPQD